MPDFTLNTFHRLLSTLKEQQYTFQTFAKFLREPAPRTIILRHDVDARKMNSLQTARIEKELGITGTYNFRIVPESFDIEIIKQIAGFGHEIGYHYEDLTIARGDCDKAMKLFEENLARLRRVVPVETICMHGSPLSKYDNRQLWEKYNYRDYDLIGEPYFDVDFNEVLYLTDTGRRWDGEAVSVRDKAKDTRHRTQGTGQRAEGEEQNRTKRLRDKETKRRRDERTTSTMHPVLAFRFHSTFDLILAAESSILPDKIMLTVHPQRWDNRLLSWIRELVWQNVKNLGKRIVTLNQR
jgi:hypothetical protein